MRARLKSVGAGALLVVLAGCGDSTGITPDLLTGTWTATEWVVTNQANTSQTVDALALGFGMTLVIRADSTYTATFTQSGELPDVETGTIGVSGNLLTIAESGQGSPTTFTAVRDGDRLTITTSNEEYDFDGTGTEPASMRIVLTRS